VRTIALIGLMKMELPDYTVLLCDGGMMEFDAEIYLEADPIFGTLGSVEPMNEGIGDEVPALQISLLPPGTSEPGDIAKPEFQRSRLRFWIGEYDVDTGELVGAPDLVFDGQLDQCALEIGPEGRSLSIGVVSKSERMFAGNTGNSLNPTWHKSIWSGETGHDNATGLSVPVAWGTEKPAAAYSPGREARRTVHL
jgi:hypothetical protein